MTPINSTVPQLSTPNGFQQFFNYITGSIAPLPPPMEDIIVTLDEKELETFKKVKLDSTIEESCMVCMCKMEKGNEMTELPCSHKFHSECIESWLKDYNYICPICRKECGKGVPKI